MERRSGEIDGLSTSWLWAGDAPLLYVHGVPDSATLWTPFLARTGGIAVDLPGFGRSGKPAEWPYSIAGYGRFLHAFLDRLGLERVRLVAHGWGAVGLTLAHRIERLAALDLVPFLPGHRWHPLARAWRTPLIGELAMGFTGPLTLRWPGRLSREHAAAVLEHFDHGTQRAILKLYRATRTAGGPYGAVRAPALVLWGERDRYFEPAWAERLAAALGGPAETEIAPGAGHWPWLDRPEVLPRVARFLGMSAG